VWPAVRREVPQAHLVLAGAGPTPRLVDRARQVGGVTVTGELPDLEPCYLQASAFVAPLFVGGGLKFKVPQAMLHGLPVTATPVAAEGVVDQAPAGTFWAVTDDAGVMADRLAQALLAPEDAAATGRRAADWCRGHYCFRRSTQRLLDRYADLVATA
jgi:glycosyltransferase involved in cell wall biosynthesis